MEATTMIVTVVIALVALAVGVARRAFLVDSTTAKRPQRPRSAVQKPRQPGW